MMGTRIPVAVTVFVAIAGGALWGLCFVAEPWHPLGWVALVPLFLLLSQPRPWLLGVVARHRNLERSHSSGSSTP